MLNITNYQRNAIKTTARYHLIPARMAIIKKSTNSKCWRGCGGKGSLLYCCGNVNQYSHCGEQYGEHLRTTNRTTIWSSNPTPGHISRETVIQKYTCTAKLLALFTTAKTWKQPKCPSTEGCIKKRWYMYTMENYSATKKTQQGHLQQHGWTKRWSYEVKSVR